MHVHHLRHLWRRQKAAAVAAAPLKAAHRGVAENLLQKIAVALLQQSPANLVAAQFGFLRQFEAAEAEILRPARVAMAQRPPVASLSVYPR